jgi:hypothetical protein
MLPEDKTERLKEIAARVKDEFGRDMSAALVELRYPRLALDLVFHLWLEYSLKIPLFQCEVLSAYVLFIDGQTSSSQGHLSSRPQTRTHHLPLCIATRQEFDQSYLYCACEIPADTAACESGVGIMSICFC